MANAVSPGRLVLIVGLPGSGKTMLATELAASMPASRMSPDDWMVASGIGWPRNSGDASNGETSKVGGALALDPPGRVR